MASHDGVPGPARHSRADLRLSRGIGLAPRWSPPYQLRMLTIVMTTRDRAAGLARTLDAYERLDAPPGGYRLVVADDGSRDETRAVLEARAGRLPLVVAPRAAARPERGPQSRARGHRGRPRGLHGRRRAAASGLARADAAGGRRSSGGRRDRGHRGPPLQGRSRRSDVLRSVRRGPTFAWVERPADGPVDPTEAVSPSFAVRASLFRAGLRFDESIGPDGTADYAMGSETELLLRLQREGVRAWYVRDAVVEHVVTAAQLEESTVLRRAYRYGRGRWRLRTSRLARARLRVRGVPLAVLADLLSRRLSYARALRRGDPGRALRAAWRDRVPRGPRRRGPSGARARARARSAPPLVPAPLRASLLPRPATAWSGHRARLAPAAARCRRRRAGPS